MKSCLETLYAFLTWIPLYYIFEIDITENILIPLIKNQNFSLLSIKCLTEVFKNFTNKNFFKNLIYL